MNAFEVRQRIKSWEWLRIPFNFVCLLGAWFAWEVTSDIAAFDERPLPPFSHPDAILQFAFGFAVLNISYCLIYAVEFVGLAISAPVVGWLRTGLYGLGCTLGFLIAFQGSRGIAHSVALEVRIKNARQVQIEESQRKFKEAMRLREEAKKRAQPNKAPEPTPGAVTPRATERSSK